VVGFPVLSSLEAVNASADFSRTPGRRSQLRSYETQGIGEKERKHKKDFD
jgi:hypothetical protein